MKLYKQNTSSRLTPNNREKIEIQVPKQCRTNNVKQKILSVKCSFDDS